MVKFVVDIEKKILSVGCEYHMECAEELTEKEESRQKNLWGANLYKDGRIDFVSLINIKPLENNRAMEIQSGEIKRRVEEMAREILCKRKNG
jgi:hypothetical protein